MPSHTTTLTYHSLLLFLIFPCEGNDITSANVMGVSMFFVQYNDHCFVLSIFIANSHAIPDQMVPHASMFDVMLSTMTSSL